MLSITVKPAVLDSKILKLKILEQMIKGTQKGPQAITGGGRTVANLEEMDKLYAELEKQLLVLVSNSIGFMQNVRNSYDGQDKNIAKSF